MIAHMLTNALLSGMNTVPVKEGVPTVEFKPVAIRPWRKLDRSGLHV